MSADAQARDGASAADPEDGDLLALYGSLLRGLGGMEPAGVNESLRYVGPCVLEGQLFDLGDYPGLRQGTGLVVGELHVVLDARAFLALDHFEGFDASRRRDSLYLRERVALIEPAETQAWVYFYNHVPDLDARIESGDWRAFLAEREGNSGPG